MQIYEEYFKRHSIGVSLVKHVSLGYLFFREPSDTGFKWTVVSIIWNEPTIHPGSYSLRFSRPIHDCKSLHMELIQDDERLNWDEYEEYLYEWVTRCDKNHVITSRRQVILTAWEMFVHAYDSFFASNFDCLSSLLFDSLDFTSPINFRYSRYQSFMKHIDCKLNPFKTWKMTANSYSKNYCHWLSDLIQKDGH